jgi:hypothetical protein
LASPASPESQAVHIRFVPNATHPLQQKQSFNYLIGARRRRLAEAQPPIFTALHYDEHCCNTEGDAESDK